ncbi:hypothetical protein RI367_000413 [Sorochytrium milnesiophthora]
MSPPRTRKPTNLRIQTRTTPSLLQSFKAAVADLLRLLARQDVLSQPPEYETVRSMLYQCITTASELLYVTLPSSTKVSSLAVESVKKHSSRLLAAFERHELAQHDGDDDIEEEQYYTDFIVGVTDFAEAICNIIDSYVHRDEILTPEERKLRVLTNAVQQRESMSNSTDNMVEELSQMIAEDNTWKDKRRQYLADRETELLQSYERSSRPATRSSFSVTIVPQQATTSTATDSSRRSSVVSDAVGRRGKRASVASAANTEIGNASPARARIRHSIVGTRQESRTTFVSGDEATPKARVPSRYFVRSFASSVGAPSDTSRLTLPPSEFTSPLSASMFGDIGLTPTSRRASSVQATPRQDRALSVSKAAAATDRRRSSTAVRASPTRESIKALGQEINDLRQQFSTLNERLQSPPPAPAEPTPALAPAALQPSRARRATAPASPDVTAPADFPEIQFVSPVRVSLDPIKLEALHFRDFSAGKRSEPASAHDIISSYRSLLSPNPGSMQRGTMRDDLPPTSAPLLSRDAAKRPSLVVPPPPVPPPHKQRNVPRPERLSTNLSKSPSAATGLRGSTSALPSAAYRTPRVPVSQFTDAVDTRRRSLVGSAPAPSAAAAAPHPTAGDTNPHLHRRRKSSIRNPYESLPLLTRPKTWRHQWTVMRVDLRGKCDYECALCEQRVGIIDKKVVCKDCRLTCHYDCHHSMGGAELIECAVYAKSEDDPAQSGGADGEVSSTFGRIRLSKSMTSLRKSRGSGVAGL